MKAFLACMIFCGCTIDTAFETPQSAAVWGVAFVTALIVAAVMGKNS